ncbi:reverse transcriptase [Trichonephila clavipes]|nr:reverse transcriptase [Trichonephila clavipes]
MNQLHEFLKGQNQLVHYHYLLKTGSLIDSIHFLSLRLLDFRYQLKRVSGTHIAETSEKGLRRLNLLKRLTATKKEATQDVLTTVYKTYVRPVLNYGCEVVTLVSTTNFGKCDVVQNSAIRIITGLAKSTAITAMQLQTGNEPLDSRRHVHSQILGESQKKLKFCVVETIEERYPANEWLHIYTDGSYLPERNGAGVGRFCKLFEGSLAVGKNATNYDGEVLTVCETTTHLLSAGLAPAKVVFFIDSQAAILALSSKTPTDCIYTIQCRTKIAELISYGRTAALQWIPSHVGIPGNKRGIKKDKQGVESTQPEVPLTLSRAKSIISTHIEKYTAMTQKTKSFGKPWETLAPVGPIPRHLERTKVISRFRLTIGHDILGAYLHWLGVAANEACPL